MTAKHTIADSLRELANRLETPGTPEVGRVSVYLQPESEPDPGWVDAIAAALAADPENKVIGATVHRSASTQVGLATVTALTQVPARTRRDLLAAELARIDAEMGAAS